MGRRECVCFVFSGVRMKYCPGVGWERVGTRGDLLLGLQVRLRERPRLTLLWYARARPGVRVDVSRCRRRCSAHRLNGTGIVAGGIPPLDADSWMNSARKSRDLMFLTCKQSSKLLEKCSWTCIFQHKEGETAGMGGKEKTQNSEEQKQVRSRPLLRMRQREQERF